MFSCLEFTYKTNKVINVLDFRGFTPMPFNFARKFTGFVQFTNRMFYCELNFNKKKCHIQREIKPPTSTETKSFRFLESEQLFVETCTNNSNVYKIIFNRNDNCAKLVKLYQFLIERNFFIHTIVGKYLILCCNDFSKYVIKCTQTERVVQIMRPNFTFEFNMIGIVSYIQWIYFKILTFSCQKTMVFTYFSQILQTKSI